MHKNSFALFQVFSDPGNLVLVMGLSDEEEAYYRSRLQSTDAKAMPKKVTSEYSSVDRQRLYKEGGVLFVTTRILVVDMLTDKIPMGNRAIIFFFSAQQKIMHTSPWLQT